MIPTTNNCPCALKKAAARIQDLEERLAIAKRGLHVISLRYGTEGLAHSYLSAIEHEDHDLSRAAYHV